MTFWSRLSDRWGHWCEEQVFADWSENRLLSRKWGLVFSVVYVAIACDLAGHELGPNTTQIIVICVPAFVTIQGFVDMIKYRVVRKRQKGEAA